MKPATSVNNCVSAATLSHTVGSIPYSYVISAMGKPQIAIRMPPSLLEELNSHVELTGTSKTDVVVSAIADRRYRSVNLI
ncbi:hypothetical protein VB620_09145 [Nodularia harveyana UHCC-0300]|uniref:Uncharacterized protein n=1 Tax=Nodularia harveyana UHCC-0300 TaxID=2974287 RepID=A0ABU5UD90_9CYAN|nr:hypothetical protein [Nodularia harveyana]MEA5581504.1 hypothetical protein [Nodularia harveyana UHCC-0300]